MKGWGAAWLAVLVLLLVVRAVVQAQESSPPFDLDDVTVPEQPPLAVLGEPVYQQNCAPCHGAEGRGDGPMAAELPVPPPAFADPESVWARSPAELFHVTKFGRIENLMPPWQDRLSDPEIWQAVYYAWSLHTSAEAVATGDALYAESCAGCHGEGGAGDGPRGEGQLPDFSEPETMMAISQADLAAGWQEAHPEIGDEWTDEQQRAVLEYVRTFTYRPPWSFSLRDGPGTIRGQVEQQTPGGGAFDGPVTLEVYAGTRPLATLEQPVGDDDTFVFEQLPVDAGLIYLVTTEYNGIRYSTSALTFDEETGDAPALQTTLPVYETTDDPAGVFVQRGNWIVEQSPGALLVGQVFAFGSRGDRTYVGQSVEGVDVPVTLALPLPPGATNVALQDGEIGDVYRRVGDLVYDTRPVPPGEVSRQIFVRYTVPYQGRSTVLAQPFVYPIENLSLLVANLPDLAVTVEASQMPFSFVGEEEIQGATYLEWNGASLPPQEVAVALSGLLAEGAQDPRAQALGAPAGGAGASAPVATLDPAVSVGVAGLLVVVLVGAFLWQRRQASQSDVARAAAGQREALIQQIAQLDDLHVLGEIDTAEWQHRRTQLKQDLLSLTRRQEDAGHA